MAIATLQRAVLRRIFKSPAYLSVVLLTLGLGIGANVAIFTVVNAILLQPLPYPDSDELVLVGHRAPGLDLDIPIVPDALYFLYREVVPELRSLAIFNDTRASFTGRDRPESVRAAQMSASLLSTLRVPPQTGRALVEEDERPGAPPVAILSDVLWKSRFGGAQDIVGTVVELDGEATEVVGVMPPGFAFPDPETRLWTPLPLDPNETRLGNFSSIGLARLPRDATMESVSAKLAVLLADLEERFPDDRAAPVLANAGLEIRLSPIRDLIVGSIEAMLWVVLGAVGFLLLIACANVANLFLVRSEARQRETAIRHALGESRLQSVVSTLVESVALGVGGGVVGLAAGWVGVRLLVRLGPQELPRLNELSIDAAVVAFALTIALVSGLLFGLLPAARTAMAASTIRLSDGGRTSSSGRQRHRARRLLVGLQMALALLLLVGSGLMARSFERLSNVDPGFRSDDVLSFGLSLPEESYPDAQSIASFYGQVTENLRALPGAEVVGAVSELPLSGSTHGSGFSFEDHPREEGGVPPILSTKAITGDYLQAMGIPLLQGRSLEPRDEENVENVVVVSESVARHYWPDEDPLGKALRPGGRPDREAGEDWFRVVGVVGPVHDQGLHQEPVEIVYFPLVQKGEEDSLIARRNMSYVIRGLAGSATAGMLRDAVWAVDPGLPITDIRPLEDLVRSSKANRAFTMFLLLVSAAFALLLGAVGLYAVISFLVSQRRREIAVRMAIGARAADIRDLVLREALVVAVLGMAVGLAAAAGLTRFMSSILYETSPLDAVTFVVVSVLMLAVALLASYLPARRAAAIDPIRALRWE